MRQQQGRPRWRRYPSPTKGAKTTSLSDVEDRALPPSKALLHCPQGVGGGHYRARRQYLAPPVQLRSTNTSPTARGPTAPQTHQTGVRSNRTLPGSRSDQGGCPQGYQGGPVSPCRRVSSNSIWSPFVPPRFSVSTETTAGHWHLLSVKNHEMSVGHIQILPHLPGLCPEKSHNEKIASFCPPNVTVRGHFRGLGQASDIA